MPAKPRKVPDQATSASDSATEDATAESTQEAGNASILSAISSLRCEIHSVKSDIGEIIDPPKIEQSLYTRRDNGIPT